MGRQVVKLLCVAWILLSLQGGRASAQSMDEAHREFLEHRIDKAFELYAAAARGDGDPRIAPKPPRWPR